MKFEDSCFDFQQIFETLFRVEKMLQSKMPSSRSYSPEYAGDYAGIGSAYMCLSEEVAYGCEGISEIVTSYIQTGKWGRPKTKVAFWLKAFLETLILYFLAARETQPYADCILSLPNRVKPYLDKTDQEVLEWFLSERWAEHLAPLWMKNNAPNYVYIESWDMSYHTECSVDKFRNALDEISNSDFLWNMKGSFYQTHKNDFPYYYL